jgi:hypothetical protein
MTKREFDAETKRNFGCRVGQRTEYRRGRGQPLLGCVDEPRDRLAERAWWRRHNSGIPVLGLASPYRAPVCWRLLRRFPCLPYSREELEALARRRR